MMYSFNYKRDLSIIDGMRILLLSCVTGTISGEVERERERATKEERKRGARDGKDQIEGSQKGSSCILPSIIG